MAQVEDGEGDPEEKEAARVERMGLTPDWIIQVPPSGTPLPPREHPVWTGDTEQNRVAGERRRGRDVSLHRGEEQRVMGGAGSARAIHGVAGAQVAAFTVFQLPRPTPARPYIEGLLDPCTNSLVAPNIPAQFLYDKKVRVRPLPPCQTCLGHAKPN